MLTVSIFIASGGAFLFTLILAKYWPASEYGNFVSGFAVISYLSFPVLYGLVPQVLRKSMRNSRKGLFSIAAEHVVFLFAYISITCVVLLIWSPNLLYFSIIGCVLLIILAIGIVEALIRDRGFVIPVFHARALGMFLSIGYLLMVLTFDWERIALTSFFARLIPSACVLAVLYFMMKKIAQPGFDIKNDQEKSKLNNIFGVVDATFIALIVGVFQYAFIVVGKRIIEPVQYISISMGMMISMTVCLKLIEPYIFRLYISSGELSNFITERQWSGKWSVIFFKLFIFSYGAQILVNVILFNKYAFFDAALFSIGSTFVSVAHFLHLAIYLRGNVLKLSASLLIAMFGSLAVLAYSHRADMFPTYFLAMATFYLFFVARAGLHKSIFRPLSGAN